jgi:hypothetical protein
MKNLKFILIAIFSIIFLVTACKKEEQPMPQTPTPMPLSFSGVVFEQLRTDSIGSYNYGVKKVIAPATGVYLLPTTGGNGISNNSYDSLSVNFQSGDSIHVGAWKDGNEAWIEPYVGPYSNSGGNPHFKIRTKLYFNGILLYDTISINGQYWFHRLP